MTSPGAELSRSFFLGAVRPLVSGAFPGLPYAAALVGYGSDVLGYDDGRSQDHDWGCRVTLLVTSPGPAVLAALDDRLERDLPAVFAGRPVRFPTTRDPRVRHRVEVTTVPSFVTARLGVDATRQLGPVDWLVMTGQGVLEVTAGPVFHDGPGTLTEVRRRLAWYPDDVWRYVLAAGWTRISQELPYVGRTGELGDDSGSRIVAARLARGIVQLGLLLDRRWAPYAKWTGVAFARTPISGAVAPLVARALGARTWRSREAALAAAVSALAAAQAERGLPVAEPAVVPFHDRPAQVVNPGLVAAVSSGIADPLLRRLPPGLGSLEQWVDNVDVLSDAARRAAVASAYRALLADTGAVPSEPATVPPSA